MAQQVEDPYSEQRIAARRTNRNRKRMCDFTW